MKSSKISTDMKPLLSSDEFYRLSIVEMQKLLGISDSVANFLRKYAIEGGPKNGKSYYYHCYLNWHIIENSPLGKALS